MMIRCRVSLMASAHKPVKVKAAVHSIGHLLGTVLLTTMSRMVSRSRLSEVSVAVR